MVSQVWISGILQNYLLGDKLGLRARYSGEEWGLAQFESPAPSEKLLRAIKLYLKGVALEREEFPEAMSVWDFEAFASTKDVFFAGGFLAVKGGLAEELKDFDFGEGGLLPFDILGPDLKTPIGLKSYFLNLGARKTTFNADKSTRIRPYLVDRVTNTQVWSVRSDVNDGDLVLTPDALNGPDVWVETQITGKIFFSSEVGEVLKRSSMADEFRLARCAIEGGTK
jgi:hypothetical protein